MRVVTKKQEGGKESRQPKSKGVALLSSLTGRKRTALFASTYLVIWAIASWLFYLRFPNAFHHPNFYAEDGNVFARTLFTEGFLQAIGTSFSGYYQWGIYLLQQVAIVINGIFFGGEFVNLPRTFALVSYGTFGLIATLPILLFHRWIKPMALLLATLLIIFVPMLDTDYAIIGIIGHLKFAVVFVAFYLLMYRHLLPEKSWRFYLVDLLLLICAYTSTTVILMLPFALLRYWSTLKNLKDWRTLRYDNSFRSLVVLGVAILPQFYFWERDGIPRTKGYLDEPYDSARTTEIFFARTFLYGLLLPIYKTLTDNWAQFSMAIATLLGLLASGKRYRTFFIFGWLTALGTTLLFVANRTGVSRYFYGYDSGGFDQFFFTQNWIVALVISIALVELVSKLRFKSLRIALYVSALWYIAVHIIPNAGSYGEVNLAQPRVDDIYVAAKRLCSTRASDFDLTIYPSSAQRYEDIPRFQLCTPSAINHVPRDFTIDFGTRPTPEQYFANLGISNFFTQTFVSPEAGLNGLAVYFSTFGEDIVSPYNLTLYEGDCKKFILSQPLPIERIKDNYYSMISFPEQPDSQGKTYCFSVASSRTNEVSQLAVQQSLPNIYPTGVATINGAVSERDIVFRPHYR